MSKRKSRKYSGMTEDSLDELGASFDLWKEVKREMTLPKSKKGKKSSKNFKSYIIFADSHVQNHNLPALKAIWAIMDDHTFDGIINLGDFMDFDCISHWNKEKVGRTEGKRLKDDYIVANAILDEFDKRLPKEAEKYFYYGNHERFYYDFIEAFPQLTGMFDPKDELRLKERGYVVYDKINHIGKLGKLSLTHGMYAGKNALKTHLASFQTNTMHGHTHTMEMSMASSPAKEIAIWGMSIGCTCDMNPAYMQDRPHGWTHGFAVVHVYDKNFFDVDFKRIVNGKVVYNGKLYNGNA
jgi:predicted phosphodiesterase